MIAATSHFNISFRERLLTLLDASRFLYRDVAGCRLIQRIGSSFMDEAQHNLERLQSIQQERPEHSCALVLGEFNSGKSTLINALFGRLIAASDVFELTQAVCRYIPISRQQTEYVVLTSRIGTRPSIKMDIETFVARSQAKELGDFTQVTAYVYSDMGLVLVDTPGLGATLQHELDALSAVGSTADVVLCVIDCECLGGGRDAATIARMREIELPFICILTKTDIIEPDEQSIAADYISESFGVDRGKVFPVAAQIALSQGNEDGISLLKNFLETEIAPQSRVLREKALVAQARDLAAAYRILFEQTTQTLREVGEDVDEYARYMLDMAEPIADDLCSSLEEMLLERLQIEGELNLRSPINEQDFSNAVKRCFSDETNHRYLQKLKEDLDKRFQQEWVAGIQDNLTLMQENLRTMQAELNMVATRDLERTIQQQKMKKEAITEATSDVFKGAAIVAGVAILTHAFFPATLLGAPYLIEAWRKLQKGNSLAEDNSDAEKFQSNIREWRNQVVSDALKEFRPKMIELNHKIAHQAAENYAIKKENWPISQSEFNTLRSEAELLRRQLTTHSNVS